MKTPEQATMEWVSKQLAREKDRWESGKSNHYFEWETYSERLIRWHNDVDGYRKQVTQLSNEVERLKKDNEWLTAKVGGRAKKLAKGVGINDKK